MKSIGIIGLLLWMTTALNAQKVTITIDEDVKAQVMAYNNEQLSKRMIPVYRIQFGATSDRRAMETELANFKSEFNLKADWFQKGPYYYLKTGVYRSKLEAYPDFKAISSKYGSAVFIVENVKKQFVLE